MSTAPPPAPADRWTPKPPPAVAAAAAAAEEAQKAIGQDVTRAGDDQQQPQPPAPQPTPPPPQPAPQPQPTPPPQQLSAAEYEHRYNSAMGRVSKYEEENRKLNERLNSMEKLLSTVQARSAKDAQPAAPVVPRKLVTDDEVRDYGGDFLEVVGRKAKEELLPEVESLKQTVTDLQGRLAAVGHSMALNGEEEVWARLRNKVPDAETMNNDPQFIEWLERTDPYSGAKRGALLADAYARHDASRVINFFEGYKSETAAVDPPTAGQHRPTNGGAKPDLAMYAAPGRATSPPQQAAAGEKPVYTDRDIAGFFAAKRMGRYKGREAEAAAIEADIFTAQHEGRIR